MSKEEKRRKREEKNGVADDSQSLPRYHMTVLLFK